MKSNRTFAALPGETIYISFHRKKDPVCSCDEPLESLFLKLTNIAKRGSFLMFLLPLSPAYVAIFCLILSSFPALTH